MESDWRWRLECQGHRFGNAHVAESAACYQESNVMFVKDNSSQS